MPMYADTTMMFEYLPQVSQTPENEALFTKLIQRASGMIDDVLIGVDASALDPVPPSVEQVCLELAVNMWRGRDRGMWAQSSGVDGEGALQYVGQLTPKQTGMLRQIRIQNDAIAI